MNRITSVWLFVILSFVSGFAMSESEEFTPEKFKKYLEILPEIKQPVDTQVVVKNFQPLLAPGAKVEERVLNTKESGSSYTIELNDPNTGISIAFDGIKPNLDTPHSSAIVANGRPLGLKHLPVREFVKLYGPWVFYRDEGESQDSESTIIFQSGIFKIKIYGRRTKDPNDILPYMITVNWPRAQSHLE